MSSVQRRESILQSVDAMISAYEHWRDDDGSPDVPTEKLERAIESAIYTCGRGDIPADCRRLVASMGTLAQRWDEYKNGERDAMDRPRGVFWDAFSGVVKSRKGATVQPARSYETVRMLRDQKVSDAQIAVIYKGLFHDEYGRVRVDLIDREAKEPGSVVPKDWIHPDELARVAAETAALDGQIATLQQLSGGIILEKASVEEMLREGAFPAQIANVKGIPLDDVLTIARQAGITPNEYVDPRTQRAPHEKPISPQDELTARGLDTSFRIVPDETAARASDDELENAVLEAIERTPNAGPGELAAELSEKLGRPISGRQINKLLKAQKA